VSFPKFIRWLLWLSACFALGLLCLLLTSRWWLPPLLPRVAAMWAVELASAERVEGGRLRLSGVALELNSASVAIDQVELPAEWTYLRERFFGEWSGASTLRIGHVQILAGDAPAPAEPETGELFLPQIREQILQGMAAADPWLPRLELGRIEYRDSEQVIAAVEAVAYQGRHLAGEAVFASLPGRWPVAVALGAEAPWRLEFSHADWALSGSLQLESDGQQTVVEGRLQRGDSQAQLTARFGSLGWLPEAARVSSEGFELSGIRLPLKEGLFLTPLRLNAFQAQWDGEDYRFQSSGQTLVQAADVADQTVAFELSGGGNRETLRLEAGTLLSDWANVQLSEPLTVDFQRRSFLGEARLRAELDLGQQPWFEADGRIELQLSANAESLDALHFDLRGQGLSYADYAAERVEAQGWLNFEKLHLDTLTVTPPDAKAGEAVELSGTADLKVETVNFVFSASLGADWVNRIMGQDVLVAPFELRTGQVTGPWGAPEVRGEVRTTLQTEAIEPVELSAELRWDGRGRLAWQGVARCNGAAIESVASVMIEEDAWSLLVESLRWSDPERPELNLKSPVRLRWQRSGDSFEERLSVSAFVLQGDDMGISATYMPAEGLELLLRNASLGRVDRWVQADLPQYHIESIRCELTDFRPYLAGRVQIAVEERIDAEALARLELVAVLKERAITVQNLLIRFSGEEILQGGLELPLRLRLPLEAADVSDAKKPFYAFGGGALRGKLAGRASPEFASWLQARTGLQIAEMTLNMEIAGDLSEPVGHVHLQATEVEIGPGLVDARLPTIDGLDLRVQVDEKNINVQRLNFSLNQSPVRAAFTMPMEVLIDQAKAAAFDPMQILRATTGEIRLQAWKMEDWLDWLPPYFRRTGHLSGSLEMAPELMLSGQLRFEDFGFRPTASLASIDQVAGELHLKNRLLRVDQASARFGGSRVEFAGELDLTDFAQPQWFFDVKGDKVPLVRTTEMILRSDLDIHVEARDPALSPLVAGHLKLRSSTLLVEFDPLAPRLKKGTAARPPFFEITEEPFAAWRFDLQATGDRFMRVRSPYFSGRFSADMTLKGTFAEPQLLGSVRTGEAKLSFPGAKFDINEGEALIEASRPNEVQLAFSGIAQKASKVIVMEVSQTLEEPLIHFESTPPMSQVDILRLLATGSATGGGMGNLGIYLGQGMMGAGGMNDGFADKLTVDLGEETSRSGRSTFGARYELTPRWSVEGEYDVFDAYNANLIWTIFKR
jgi:translocation and assembly module TamB